MRAGGAQAPQVPSKTAGEAGVQTRCFLIAKACADGVPLRQCFDGFLLRRRPQLHWMKVAIDWCRVLPQKQCSGV
jgi:hypothetical protein